MPTPKQVLGRFGETTVVRSCRCPKCKREKTFRRLPTNFKCADIICDFCGYLAQVKAVSVISIDKVPNRILGAAWGVQKARMAAGIYFPLFIVLVCGKQSSIHYLSADAQKPEMFLPRAALSKEARRAGWRGFVYDLKPVANSLVKLR